MKDLLRITGILLAATVCSCSHTPKATEAPATRVKIEAVKATRITSGRTYSGTIEESSGTVLSFSVAGTISRVHVGVGDRVAKGQLIATLDAANLRNAYDIAMATLNQAQDTYDRMRQLHEAKAIPDIKWVEIENTLSQAKSATEIARKSLNDANLYASVAGYVSEKISDTGMNVAPGMPVVKVVDISPVKACIAVPENEIARIHPGCRALISAAAIGDKRFDATLTEKGVTANPLSRSYDVKFEISNTKEELLPGMICDVELPADSSQNVIAVASDAILLDSDNSNFVWIAVRGRAEKRTVITDGMTAGTRIVISSGLAPGDSIIVSGQQKVSPGTRIINILK